MDADLLIYDILAQGVSQDMPFEEVQEESCTECANAQKSTTFPVEPQNGKAYELRGDTWFEIQLPNPADQQIANANQAAQDAALKRTLMIGGFTLAGLVLLIFIMKLAKRSTSKS